MIPATDPKASEVFFLINNMQADPIYVDDLVARLPLSFPMLLLWGEDDPWIVPERVSNEQLRTILSSWGGGQLGLR